MKDRVFIVLVILLSLLSCKKNTNQNSENKSLNSESKNYTTIERYFPEKKHLEKFDTLVQNVQISITTNLLDAYVTNEHEILEDKIKYIDKYRDTKIELKVVQNSEIIIDTIFVKESFLNYTNQSFLNISNLYYSLDKIQNDTIVFYARIIKPETDWVLSFRHNLDLKTKKFSTIEVIE